MKKLCIWIYGVFLVAGSLTVAASAQTASAQAAAPVARPKITGISHMALFVSDLAKTRAFYKDFLGYDEVYTLKKADGSDRIAFIKINEDQYLELFREDPKNRDAHMNHIALQVDNVEQARLYLASQGVKVPAVVGISKIGNHNFNITDPDGHTVEIVQYMPDSWTRQNTGKHMPDTRISTHIPHLGITIGDLDASMKFYGDILGMKETWRGSPSVKQLQWVNMRVPDGTDYLEFMLYSTYPDADHLGVKNHICLVVPDIDKAVAILNARPARKDYTREIEITTGVNGKRQANLYDPDGTRVELMEPNTADGKPRPSSTAPAPSPKAQ